MQSAGEAVEDGAQVAVLPGDRPDEDPAQVVLHAPHAALGRRLALGVGHHQVVGVVLGGEGHEAGARRLDPGAVVLGREEHHVVPLADEPAGQRQQRRGVALGRRGAQHEAPAAAVAADVTASPSPASRRRRPRAGASARPRRSIPRARARCSRAPSRRTPSNVAGSLDMFSSTTVAPLTTGVGPGALGRGQRAVRADGQVLAGPARRDGPPAQLEHRGGVALLVGHVALRPGRPSAATAGRRPA